MVSVTLYLEPLEKNERPVKLMRIVEIPLGPAVTGAVKAVTGQGDQVDMPSESDTDENEGEGG